MIVQQKHIGGKIHMNANPKTCDRAISYGYITSTSQVESIANSIPLKPATVSVYENIVSLHKNETRDVAHESVPISYMLNRRVRWVYRSVRSDVN
jgi:hypothetical protein